VIEAMIETVQRDRTNVVK